MKLQGLSEEEARRRLRIYGKNEIQRWKKVSPLQILLEQFKSPVILLLIGAAIISFSMNYMKGEGYYDSALILLIVFVAGIAGFIQDYKAEKAVEALREMTTPKAKVIREGKEIIIDATEVVPGDLIVLESGDVIPADAEVVEGEIEVDESILTGESRALRKKKGDKIYSSCAVYVGNAIAEVFATGMRTEVGKIASKMQEIEEAETPFQVQMKKFTRKIVRLTVLVAIITFIVGVMKFSWTLGLLNALSLAVAAIPEGLPAVIAIALSLGARSMVKRNALVRRLVITESIGSVDVICTDKTGTITEGKMKVREIWQLKESKLGESLALKCCFYCNDAKEIVEEGKTKLVGDETDIALKEFSKARGLKDGGERIDEIPFTSERKLMTVAYDFNGKKIVFSKGAPEVIIKKCNRILWGNRVAPLDEATKKKILEKNKEFASQAYRVLALAYKEYKKPLESNLIFIGLVALSDPPRPEVREAVEECYSAGIRVIMITGDNPETAKAIAREVGIRSEGVITGEELDGMEDEELMEYLNKGVNIFARTSPYHKLRILELLQADGHVVAMTGDGVNDALALKKADVGISMGIRGTQVAKEASDIVLLDDNFATIRNAIKEGRRIFDNIRKFVDYLLTCNVAEVMVVLLATLAFPFVSLYPMQILWINFITDGLPAIALSIDPARPDVMKRKPRRKEEGVINRKLALMISGIGIEKSLIILGTFLAALPFGIDRARSTLFTGFIMYEFVRIAVIRYNEKLASLKDWLANKFLIYSLLASFGLQLLILYSPLAYAFKAVPLGLEEWLILLAGTAVGFATGILLAWVIDKATKEEY